MISRRLPVLFLVLLPALLPGADHRFSQSGFDPVQGIIVFEQRIDKKLYLCLDRLADQSKIKIEISDQSAIPVVCAGAVVICSYGLHKIVLYDYELKLLSELDTGASAVPFYCNRSDDGKFLYVLVLQFPPGKQDPKRFVYKYSLSSGKLTYESACPVSEAGTIVTYKDSVFLVAEKKCEMINFPSP
jgi:hypothetical protein